MTLSEITYDLLEVVRNANIIDDERIDIRQIEYWVHNQRALWIKRKLDKIKDFDDNLLQYTNTELEVVNRSIEPTLESDYRIMRTVDILPPTIELNYGNAILEISSPDVAIKNFTLVPFDQLRFSGFGRFNKNHIFVAIRDGYRYVKYSDTNNSPFTLKRIIERACYQNPTLVPGFNKELDQYPLNHEMIDFMKGEIVKSNFNWILTTRADETNDANGLIK